MIFTSWGWLQTFKYKLIVNDIIELMLILLGMIIVLWLCKGMFLFSGEGCLSILG